jgi:hypothetical protein
MAYRNYTDQDYQDALRSIMSSAYYRTHCCGKKCKIGAECPQCGRVNTRQSEAEIDEGIYQAYVIGGLHAKDNHNKKLSAARSAAKLCEELLITIVLDQELFELRMNDENCVMYQKEIIDAIMSANYKWMNNVYYSFEYHTNDEGKFKPHIHIKTDKTCSPSVAQIKLYNKFVKGKKWFPVYGVNVVSRPNSVATNYVIGEKRDSKAEAIEKDNIFRVNHNLKKYYQF